MIQNKATCRLEADLAQDPLGVHLKRLQAQLAMGRAAATAAERQAPLQVRAYDAALALLPEIWRMKQRR